VFTDCTWHLSLLHTWPLPWDGAPSGWDLDTHTDKQTDRWVDGQSHGQWPVEWCSTASDLAINQTLSLYSTALTTHVELLVQWHL